MDASTHPRHFDLCIIGAGSGNTIVDERFDDQTVAIVDQGVGERGSFGGTCLNAGCIPTKMLVHPATLANSALEAQRLGVDLAFRGADFHAIASRIFKRVDAIADSGLAWRRQSANITVFQRAGRFVDAHTLQVGREQITADTFVLAAGSRPVLPDVRGLDDRYLASMIHTSESIMRVPELPKHLIIVGGGYEAAEFGHIFPGLGSEVTMVIRGDTALRWEDEAVSQRFTELLTRRLTLRLKQSPVCVEAAVRGGIVLTTRDGDGIEYLYHGDALLFATGRVPNGQLMRVQEAGVALDDRGFVVVDEHQRTTVPHIWALGDICSPWMLKHVANAQARTVQHNLLNPDDLIGTDQRFVPHTVFSQPQVASVGMTEQDLRNCGARYVAFTQQYGDTAYGWAMDDHDHFCKLLADADTGQLMGAHIIGPEACSLLQPLIQALSVELDTTKLARGQYWVHPGLPEVVENALLGLERKRQEFLAAKKETN